ncbi:MAG: Gfo/Idh/MocA family oxidoreductase [Bacteroidetes bacterium]|nr:Gfo/Idh/MocA family oxidoreductase [Bacteroidota bacterium]
MSNSRRNFIKNSSATLAALGLVEFFPSDLYANIRNKVGANDKINIGLIGLKNQGFNNVLAFLKIKEVNLLAICDIDDEQINKRKNDLMKLGVNNLLVYKDYRKLLENKDIDAVIIATPDHWHCLQLTDALSAGKHVYCEKPIANSIGEARAMLSATTHSGKVVQVNQWQRSEKHFKDAVAFVQSGKLGKIVNTKTWIYRATDPLPAVPDSPTPAGVDYAMWLGPAPMRPFNIRRFHYDFRWFWDYAGGLMTDWGVHLIDIVLWGMNATIPNSVSSLGGKRILENDVRETPDYINVNYDFGHFSNSWEHYMGTGSGQYGRGHGIAFIGVNGTLVVNREGWEVIPEKNKMEGVPKILKSDSGMDLHAINFIDVMKSGKLDDLACPIQVGTNVAINAHMGNLSLRAGDRIHWDAKKFKFDNEAANQLIKPTYHNGYIFPKY